MPEKDYGRFSDACDRARAVMDDMRAQVPESEYVAFCRALARIATARVREHYKRMKRGKKRDTDKD